MYAVDRLRTVSFHKDAKDSEIMALGFENGEIKHLLRDDALLEMLTSIIVPAAPGEVALTVCHSYIENDGVKSERIELTPVQIVAWQIMANSPYGVRPVLADGTEPESVYVRTPDGGYFGGDERWDSREDLLDNLNARNQTRLARAAGA
jgi:hypothetical protein